MERGEGFREKQEFWDGGDGLEYSVLVYRVLVDLGVVEEWWWWR